MLLHASVLTAAAATALTAAAVSAAAVSAVSAVAAAFSVASAVAATVAAAAVSAAAVSVASALAAAAHLVVVNSGFEGGALDAQASFAGAVALDLVDPYEAVDTAAGWHVGTAHKRPGAVGFVVC
jgi:hypothetical protein